MSDDNTHLYFIALVAGGALSERIREIQTHCSEEYKSKKALRSPPHITLIPPFRDEASVENILKQTLTPFFNKYHAFNVELDGFGRFDSRVIFIKPRENSYLETLHEELQNYLSKDFSFIEKEASRKFNPHVTIASGDLNKRFFQPAWQEFENKSFSQTWNVLAVHLLKHDEKRWNPILEFLFGE